MLKTPDADQYEVGDVLYGIPRHVCPTVALHQEAQVVEHGKVADHWEVVARSRIVRNR